MPWPRIMDKPISSLMTSPVRTVRADDTVEQVAAELRQHKLSFAPVVASPGNTVVGIISITDLLHLQAAKRDPKSVHAWEICSYKPLEVGPHTPVGEVARMMVERGVHHVVVTEDGNIRGVVSSIDFVRQFISP